MGNRVIVVIVEDVMVPLHLVDELMRKLAILLSHLLLLGLCGPLESRMRMQTVSLVVDVMATFHMHRLPREPRLHLIVIDMVSFMMSIKVLAIELVLPMF